MLIIFILIVI